MTVPPLGQSPDRDALAALGADAEALRRRVAAVEDLVRGLGTVTAELGERLAATAAPARTGPTTWLGFPCADADPMAAGRATSVLRDLTEWVGAVFRSYPDGALCLPECWLRHPEVAEELLWLRQAWAAAYRGRTGTPQAAGDWHDRSRPGVVRRIRAAAGTCAPETHLRDETRPPLQPADEADAIAEWWTTARQDAPSRPDPAPSARNGVR